MLSALNIKNFAIIETLELNFTSGFTVITGETGAGKSVLINAVILALGGRASTDVIRTGADHAQIEALFDVSKAPDVAARLEAAGLQAGHELVVRRTVSRSGRSRVYINGSMATITTLAHITEGLVDISGQHAHYSLLRSDTHLELLDAFGHIETLREQFGTAYGQLAGQDARIAELRARRLDRAERQDFIRFQLQELHEAELEDGDEEQRLEQEASRLRNVETLQGSATAIERILYADEGSASECIARAIREVERLTALDDTLDELGHALQSSLAIVEDSARTAGDYARHLEAEPQRLEVIENRLTLFGRLRRKYGATLSDVIARKNQLETELTELNNSDTTLESLLAEREAQAHRLRAMADTLTAARRAAAAELTSAIIGELNLLAMPNALLKLELHPVVSGLDLGGIMVGPKGADRAEFMLSANPGVEPQTLTKIASGGELSRFMLAVKRVIAARDPVSTYIFDEVDTGVGGSTAEAIGRCLKHVGRERQSICITHLPQIAALGSHHMRVIKKVSKRLTTSSIVPIADEARVEEIARMLGGATITDTLRKTATEMLTRGQQI